MSTEKKTPQIHEKPDTHPKPVQGAPVADAAKSKTADTQEVGGYKEAGLPEPTRFGDWEVKGRCSDF